MPLFTLVTLMKATAPVKQLYKTLVYFWGYVKIFCGFILIIFFSPRASGTRCHVMALPSILSPHRLLHLRSKTLRRIHFMYSPRELGG